MNVEPLSEAEIKGLLQFTYDGIGDLISTKSKAYRALSKSNPLEEMPLDVAIHTLSSNPQLLRRPIIFDEHRLLCGFNQDEIRMFIPHEQRILKLRELTTHQLA